MYDKENVKSSHLTSQIKQMLWFLLIKLTKMIVVVVEKAFWSIKS